MATPQPIPPHGTGAHPAVPPRAAAARLPVWSGRQPPADVAGLPGAGRSEDRSRVMRPRFLLVAAVLLIGAVGLNGATAFLRLHFRKEALPLRSPEGLAALPRELGSWVCVPETHTMDADMIHNLGTDKYVFREYVNTAALGLNGKQITSRDEVYGLDKVSPEERGRKLGLWRAQKHAVVNVAVTYYTGKVDTVPHVPDRCYVADGFQPTVYDELTWDVGPKANRGQGVPVRFIDFEDQTTRGAQNRCVAYFFHANGVYTQDHNQVRRTLQDLRTRYGYFAKIEVMSVLPPRQGAGEHDQAKKADRDDAKKAMQNFLTAALPEVEKLLPDWDAVKSAR